MKKTNEELKLEASQKTQGLQPLQKENARILKENNELHYELIKVKESVEYQENRWKNSLKGLEGEKSDLKFLLSQKQTGFQRLDEENQALKQKLDVILSKLFSVKSGSRPLKDKDLELENLKNSMNFLNSSQLVSSLKKNPSEIKELEGWGEQRSEELKNWAKSLREADEKIQELQNYLKSSNSDVSGRIKAYEAIIRGENSSFTAKSSKSREGNS